MAEGNPDEGSATAAQRAQAAAFRAALGMALALPYARRVPFMGAVTSRIVAPAAGWRRRIRANLALVRPDLPPHEVARLERAVPDNAGRTLIENFSTADLLARARDVPLSGAGLETIGRARRDGRPVILATGHFGNYEVARAALTVRGHRVGGLYRPMTNPGFNVVYRRTMEAFGGPVVPQGRRGTAAFVRALKEGRMMVLLYDTYVQEAPEIPFMGVPTRTATSAAEMALKYGAALVPFFSTRQPDGLSHAVEFEAEIPEETPRAMTAALNACLEARIRAHMDQWFWIHRRWKTL